MKICPNPQPWNSVYKKLTGYAKKHECVPPEPPIPLILAGWVHSSDTQKKMRWDETVAWAYDNKCSDMLDIIQDDDFYYN